MTSHQQDDDEDDELTKRFKAVFNKDPVSQEKAEKPWTTTNQEEYDIDDEEVPALHV